MSNLIGLKFRIQEYQKGYVVEMRIKEAGFFTGEKWTHVIGVSGMEHKPWYYHKFETALSEAQKFLKWDILENSIHK